MQIDVIKTLDEWSILADEWNGLLSCCSASHVPFLRHEYLTAWWQELGGGEWKQGELFVVTARQDGGLVSAAPLFFTHNVDGRQALMFIGSIEISDYLDLLTRPDLLHAFTEALLTLLSDTSAPAWQALDLYNIPLDSPSLSALETAAARLGWTSARTALQNCPYIPLPGNWEAYLEGIDKKQRHEIRRKLRRAEESSLPVRWYIVDDPAALGSEVEAFLSLMSHDPEKEKFLTPQMREQMHLISQAAFKAGWLQLAFLEVGGQKAAGYLSFDYDEHIWVYNSGIDFSFRDISPGWVLLARLLQWANQNRRREFDFMRGDEEYKYRFGGINRSVVRLTIERPGTTG
jgi:CelD/BcsL family acetyltransferase involved in cellulose biosynthesis